MNYKYKLIDKEYILSEAEHKEVTRLYQEQKRSIIYLRNNKLMINMAFIGAINETSDPTAIEERQRPLLPVASVPEVSEEKAKKIREMIRGFSKGIGTNDGWKNCLICKVDHFIPGEKTVCLGCLGKKLNEVKKI